MKYVSLFLAVCVVTACGSTPNYQETRVQVETLLNACSAKHGYDPEPAKALGDFQLGQNEIAWRQCAYAAVETQMIPHTSIPALYRELIAEDKQMTEKIQQRRMTRSSRRSRLDNLIADIERREKAQQEIREKEFEAYSLSQGEQQHIDAIFIQNSVIQTNITTLQGMR